MIEKARAGSTMTAAGTAQRRSVRPPGALFPAIGTLARGAR
jgi:hypothetical protein